MALGLSSHHKEDCEIRQKVHLTFGRGMELVPEEPKHKPLVLANITEEEMKKCFSIFPSPDPMKHSVSWPKIPV